MKKVLFVLAALLMSACFSRANDVYVAQNSTGGNSGTDCADAHSAAWFNSSSNWGAGSAQISPGTTVHLCGIFIGTAGSNMLSTQGNGNVGSPITLLFEAGADFTAPYWGTSGAIFCQNANIIIDGGSNGKIENTAAGNLLSYPNAQTAGINGNSGCTNGVVRNVYVHNLYVHVKDQNDAGTYDGSTALNMCANNTLITHNVVDNSYVGINGACGGTSNNEVSFNVLTFCNHFINAGTNSANITGFKVHDNDISDAYNWDDQANRYHHNAIMTFGDPAGRVTGDYYNNYVHGVFSNDPIYGGSHTTSLLFLEFDSSGSRVFNNVLTLAVGDPYGTANGFITIGGGPGAANVQVYNNTLSSFSGQGTCISATNAPNLIIKNNIFQHCGYGLFVSQDKGGDQIDYNVYYNTAASTVTTGGTYQGYSWSQMQGLGYDLHSVSGQDPKLDSNFKPQSGSSAIGIGSNLTVLGIVSLNQDKAGALRPAVTVTSTISTSGWTVGAYQYASGSTATAPNPPTSLALTVN